MKIRYLPALGLCLMLGGCASSIDRPWDNSTYRAFQESTREQNSQRTDRQQSFSASHDTTLESLESLGVNEAIRIAIANSSRLRRAGYKIDAATGRLIQAGLYPNPSLAFDAEALGSAAGHGGETIYRLEQEIPLGGKIRLAREVAKADRMSVRAKFIAEEFAVASRVTRAYFAAVTAHDRLARRRDLADLADQLFLSTAAHVEAGTATEPDRLRVEIVREQSQIQLETARLESEATRRTLASAMGLGVPIDLPLDSPADQFPRLPPHDELLAAVLDANNRVALAHIAIERARRVQQLTKAEAIPNLIASIGPRYSDPENETTLDLGLEIELPLFDRNQGALRAALAERLAAAAELREVQLDLLAEADEVWAVYEGALITATRYRDHVLPKADRTLDLTRQAYEHGKVDFLRLLDAQQVVAESRIDSIDALLRLHEAAAILRELAQIETPWRTPRTQNNHKEKVNR